jgi:hypothetical protein
MGRVSRTLLSVTDTPFESHGGAMKRIGEKKRQMARELLEAGRTYREVAEAMDISIGTLHNIMREPPEATASLVGEIKGRLSAKHYMLADYILNTIEPLNIHNASLRDKVIAAAILVDKARLLEGRPPAALLEHGEPVEGGGKACPPEQPGGEAEKGSKINGDPPSRSGP